MIYTDFQGEKISQLGMGTMRLPGVDDDNANSDEAAALEMFDYAYKHGMTAIISQRSRRFSPNSSKNCRPNILIFTYSTMSASTISKTI